MNELYIKEDCYHDYQKMLERAESNPVKDYISMFVNLRKDFKIDDNGIAHIDVVGSLANNEAPIHELTGNTDYASIRAELQLAMEQGAKGVLLTIDSGGGTVKGCPETAEMIANYPLPIVVYADGLLCSAAYYIASGSQLIFASPSCDNGNIGTILVMMDDREMLENFGIKTIVFKNEGAEYKSIGYDKLNDAQAAFLQERINKMGEQFKSHVTANRDINEECFKAGWYSGNDAVNLGLVDYIGNAQDAYDSLMSLI